MKHITIILICILTACNLPFDRKNHNEISKKLVQAVTQNDTTALRDLFKYRMDSLEDGLRESIFETIVAYKARNAKFIKADTSSYSLSFDESGGSQHHILYTYFKIDSNYYRLNSDYNLDDKGNIYLNHLYFADMSKECKEWITNPYCPKYLVDFRRISWQTDYSNRTFSSAKVELVNKSDKDMDFVKFRVVLQNDGETFFNQTIICNQKIFAGDFVTIDIPGLTNYYAGFSINKENLEFKGELIEVLPKPESGDCKTIAELKLLR